MKPLRKGAAWCLLGILAGVGGWLYWPKDAAIVTIEKAGGTVQPLTAGQDQGRLAITLPDTVGDTDLEQMTALDKLQPVWLQLRGRQITGRGLQSLTRLACLHGLTLHSTGIEDEDLSALKAFPRLTTLNLDGSKISARGLAHLKEMPSLRCVSLRSTALPPEAVLRFQAERPNVLVLSEFTEKSDDE